MLAPHLAEEVLYSYSVLRDSAGQYGNYLSLRHQATTFLFPTPVTVPVLVDSFKEEEETLESHAEEQVQGR